MQMKSDCVYSSLGNYVVQHPTFLLRQLQVLRFNKKDNSRDIAIMYLDYLASEVPP